MNHPSAIRSVPQVLAALLIAALFASSPGLAQPAGQTSPPPAGPQMQMKSMTEHPPVAGGRAPTAAGSTSDNRMMQAMGKMNREMAAAPATGNTDQDFVAMMIPHHQGAIDMAKVELASGKDPFLRKLAKNIVAAQKREIREMKAWQAKHPARH